MVMEAALDVHCLDDFHMYLVCIRNNYLPIIDTYAWKLINCMQFLIEIRKSVIDSIIMNIMQTFYIQGIATWSVDHGWHC